MTNAIAQTAVGVDRIQSILNANDVIPEKEGAIDPGTLKGDIEFDKIVFGYNKDAQVLKDVSFKIGAGQMIGVVGPTGSGKSTIVSLIPRFYDPSGGRVTIDGVDLRDLKLRTLRSQIAYVLQETVLFRGSVADNIAYGKGTATRDEIVAAAKLANADGFISQMPQGYDTLVGDRGDTLSGGQRQRVGIARAIIRDNPILILDEPTAALDSESEKLVMEALTRLMKGRTVITIAHRLSTIRDADKIIVLTQGVLAEQGSHDQLLALGGVYAGLYHAQFDETVAPPGTPSLAKRIRREWVCHGGRMPHQLIVLPDNTATPFLKAVDKAKKSLRVKMFLFSHPGLIDAVIRAKKRGVDVRVMLNPARRSGKSENAGTAKKLKAAGIEVSDSNPAFDVTHEKSMVVDDRLAFVQSLNWDIKNLEGLGTTRS